MSFGQLVIGPPGSGKTTYCRSMKEFMQSLGRKVVVVNLDPANDSLAEEDCDIDVRDLIHVSDVMQELELGPNGAMLYCMDFLLENKSWLKEKLEVPIADHAYLLFDCPGQVELFIHHQGMRKICDTLQKWAIRISTVHLVDAHHCADLPKFLSVILLSLSTMVFLETPHVNVLSKIDLIESFGQLAFNLDFFTEVQDLEYLLEKLRESTPGQQRHKRLSAAIADLIENYGLVQFYPLDISDKTSMGGLLEEIDQSNGYVFTRAEKHGAAISELAAQADTFDRVQALQEKYMSLTMEGDSE